MKNVFISYKQTWISKEELNSTLWFLRENIENKWYKTFIQFLDWKAGQWATYLNEFFLNNIKKSDIFLSFINFTDKSEWQIMELGMAYALWKRIILIINNKVKDNYFLIYWTSKEIYYFNDLKNLDFDDFL